MAGTAKRSRARLKLGGQVQPSGGYVGTDAVMWGQFGGHNSGIAKNQPELYLQNALPHGPQGVTEEIPQTKSLPKR